MTEAKKTIGSGIYLVIDPSMEERLLMQKLAIILSKKIAAVQIWDNFIEGQNHTLLLRKIHGLCKKHQTPLIINNRWEFLKEVELEGIHFDEIPADLTKIKKEVKGDILLGLTCGNELDQVRWAKENHMDYISFCSIFPSSSANNCEIIDLNTLKEAALIFHGPFFLAGGISPTNIKQLDELNYSGIAVISGIMNAENPDQAIEEYRRNLK